VYSVEVIIPYCLAMTYKVTRHYSWSWKKRSRVSSRSFPTSEYLAVLSFQSFTHTDVMPAIPDPWQSIKYQKN